MGRDLYKSEEQNSSAVTKFDLEGYMSVLGITAQSTEKEVLNELRNAEENVQFLLNQGFYAWTKEDEDGHQGTYASNRQASFVITRMLLDSRPISTSIHGAYTVAGREISIWVDHESSSQLLTTRLFIDGNLEAERASPFSYAQQMSQLFLRNLVEQEGEDPSRLDRTISEERNPYPFAAKMLKDVASVTFDIDKTKKMASKMESSTTVKWVSEYSLSL